MLTIYYYVINQMISYWPSTCPQSAVLTLGIRNHLINAIFKAKKNIQITTFKICSTFKANLSV